MWVDVGWGKQVGEAVQKLQGGQAERGAAGGIGGGKDVEQLVGASTHEVEPFQGERGPGTIPDQTFEARAVGGLEADAPVQAEPAAVTHGEHVGGLVGFQEAVTTKVTRDPLSDRVLEALQELGCESGGFVEAEAGGWGFGVPVWLDPLEDAVHHAEVKVIAERVSVRGCPPPRGPKPSWGAGSGSVRDAMKVRGVWQVGQTSRKTSQIRAKKAAPTSWRCSWEWGRNVFGAPPVSAAPT